jgi:hypothetical protein
MTYEEEQDDVVASDRDQNLVATEVLRLIVRTIDFCRVSMALGEVWQTTHGSRRY